MQTTKTINIAKDSITINRIKLEQTLSCIIYALMYIAKGLLMIGCAVLLMGGIFAAGDGRVSDGDIGLMLMLCGYSLLCGFSAKLIGIFMEMFVVSCRKRNIKRQHSKQKDLKNRQNCGKI